MFIEKLARTAHEKCKLSTDQKLVIGVSGGADSLALMHGLNSLGYPLVIAHLDHGLRDESIADACFVRDLADSLSLPFVGGKEDVTGYAREHGKSIEEAAREVRYTFLFNAARQVNAKALAVAHHADDQVETVLMHFTRGAALSGLTGMDYIKVLPVWDKEIPLVRPMLGIWRIEIEDYLAEVGWEPRVDLTNRDTTYFRNRLRHDLIPELETYNPKIREVLWRMGEALRVDERALDQLSDEAWPKVFVQGTNDRVELYRTGFLQLPQAIRARILLRAISRLRPDLRDVGFDAVLRGLDFAEQPTSSGEMDLVAHLSMVLIRDVLMIKTLESGLPDWGKPQLPNEYSKEELFPDSPVILVNGWKIEAKWMPEVSEHWREQVKKLGPYETWLDGDRVTLPMTVRGREVGERWQPLGMGGHHQSFQDFFITQKVPEHLRDKWPLVCSGEEVAWVAGMRPSEGFKVGDETRRILSLKLVKAGE